MLSPCFWALLVAWEYLFPVLRVVLFRRGDGSNIAGQKDSCEAVVDVSSRDRSTRYCNPLVRWFSDPRLTAQGTASLSLRSDRYPLASAGLCFLHSDGRAIRVLLHLCLNFLR